MSDELERLRAADPVTTPPGGVPPPSPHGSPRRRLRGAIAAGAGVLVLGGLIGALIIAAPSDEEAPPATEPLRMSLLAGPGDGFPAATPSTLDPASVHRAARAAGIDWYAVATPDRPGRVCLLSFGNDDRLRVHRCGPIAGGLVAGARHDGTRLRVAGLVPDGIDTVTIGRRTVPVRNNAFTIAVRRRPDVVILQGPSASRIPASSDVAVAAPVDSPPAVAVGFDPGRRPRGPAPPVPVTMPLEEAAAAVPFTLFVPDPAPRDGQRWIQVNPSPPASFPQVVIDYLPATSGAGIGLIEGPRRARASRAGERRIARDGLEIYVRDQSAHGGPRYVRTVIDGTDVQVSGGDATLDELIAVAASLRPVTP